MLWLFVTVALFQAVFSVIIDHPDSIAQGWKELGPTDPSKEVKLTFALKNQNVEGMHMSRFYIYIIKQDRRKHLITL